MSALTLRRSGEKLMKPYRNLSLHSTNQPTLICHRHSSVAYFSRASFSRSRSTPASPVSIKSNCQDPPGFLRTGSRAGQRRSATSTTMIENGQSQRLQALLTHDLLEELSSLWFQHVVDEQDLVVPSQDSMMHWFRKNEAFDQACSAKFRQTLEQTKSLNVTGEAILNAVQPRSSLEWIQLIVLLDQIPRNIYRGEESRIVFTIFDPIAQHIAQAATAAGADSHPLVRYRIGHRMWFTMPFMHSEDPTMHQKAVELIESMARDVRSVANSQEDVGNGLDENNQELQKCKTIIVSKRDAAVKLCESQLEFEIKHKDIIDKFGRYPHRNGPLGRGTTTDEQEFLDGGGDTFG
ncbi:hypothetical protein KVR01_004687 [Diaporthe batatas]|uniref:uncharacterized protein n=1 Tax=Diaporthe batatas TaxID=748121 RepID=UPI001D04F71C|nr:uncharacterized protein KVR01_004687 [Diaporthe batatas]KAG8166135.1 hypothetical protein KVR01_004687 [Diaporthe batatas]